MNECVVKATQKNLMFIIWPWKWRTSWIAKDVVDWLHRHMRLNKIDIKQRQTNIDPVNNCEWIVAGFPYTAVASQLIPNARAHKSTVNSARCRLNSNKMYLLAEHRPEQYRNGCPAMSMMRYVTITFFASNHLSFIDGDECLERNNGPIVLSPFYRRCVGIFDSSGSTREYIVKFLGVYTGHSIQSEVRDSGCQ